MECVISNRFLTLAPRCSPADVNPAFPQRQLEPSGFVAHECGLKQAIAIQFSGERRQGAGDVEPIDVLEDGSFRLTAGWQLLPPDQFYHQGYEERLDGGFILAISPAAH